MKILPMVEEVNNRQKRILADKVKKFFKNKLKDKIIAIWGLSFKPNTDDMREAPSIEIINSLLNDKAQIRVYDPVAIKEARKIFGKKITYGRKNYEILKGADALLLITEWSEFREPDFGKIHSLMRTPVIFDGRNIYNPKKLKDMGFQYFGIGY